MSTLEIVTSKRGIRKLNISTSIMSAAEEVFLEKGFRLATVDEIADRAEVTKRTLYKHFPSKIALFINMFDQHLRKLEKLLTADTGKEASPAMKIKHNFRTLFNFTLQNEKFMRMYWMLDSNEFEGEMPEELVERVSKLTKKMLGNSKALTEKALSGGSIIDIEPELLVHLFSAINKGIFLHTNKEKRFEIARIDPEKLFNALVMIMEQGLFVKTFKRTSKKV